MNDKRQRVGDIQMKMYGELFLCRSVNVTHDIMLLFFEMLMFLLYILSSNYNCVDLFQFRD
jgi:hypothetical protein